MRWSAVLALILALAGGAVLFLMLGSWTATVGARGVLQRAADGGFEALLNLPSPTGVVRTGQQAQVMVRPGVMVAATVLPGTPLRARIGQTVAGLQPGAQVEARLILGRQSFYGALTGAPPQ